MFNLRSYPEQEETDLHKQPERGFAEATIFIAIIMVSFFSVAVVMREVSAEVSIIKIVPAEGFVGTEVTVVGQINTENGSYTILFDDTPKKNGTATFTDVSDTFEIPRSALGSHEVKLIDVNASESETQNFTVKTMYAVEATLPPEPKQLQEGANVTVFAVITGGNASTTSSAKITVEDPANETYSTEEFTIQIDSQGGGNVSQTYPFQFNGGNHTTSFVGTYKMTLVNIINETLATGDFTVGLTDLTEYYRFQTVSIQAHNYTSSDVGKIKIVYNDETIFESTPNASENMIAASWTIPANASLGVYMVEIEKTPQEKQVPDLQDFTIVSKSFLCDVKTLDLDKQEVIGVLVEATNISSSQVASSRTTNETGTASFNLEAANYTFKAFWNVSDAPRKQVGETSEKSLDGNLTGTRTINVTCLLATIKVAAKDLQGTSLPLVEVNLNFTYTSRLNVSINESLSTETNVNGTASFPTLFTDVSYLIEASRYGYPFIKSTVNLTSSFWFNVTSPTHELTINVYDRNNDELPNVQVRVYEWSTGANGTDTPYVKQGATNIDGNIKFNFTFGKYGVSVYIDDVLLNKTAVSLIDETTIFKVSCKLYPLTLNVSVQDYLGQGINNANVTLEREGKPLFSSHTSGNGVARFQELVGGHYKIFIFINEAPYAITTLNLQESKTVTLKIGEIILIGGFVTKTSYSVTLIFLLMLIVISTLVFFGRRFKSGKIKE